MKKLMVAVAVTALSLVSTANAQTAYKCYGDPVCQAKRDGRSVDEAKKRQSQINRCASQAGVSANAWSRGTVPAGPKADRMRQCMGSM
ncbi:hypothetical protein [Bradyrhizobium japonicum]|uniref:hypothetical protein n=1 Tax=Bradyrhizobium japonicum TaxID=375 RepID=UPI002714A196|nr:hypothetical protein [Bradyrhizobium japonicum]WLB57435.1 hypothetical protein QIH94_16025 [Bradyrhizobium japonicum]